MNLYPVLVRVTNLRDNGDYPNRNEGSADETDDIITRRMFLVDAVSGSTCFGLPIPSNGLRMQQSSYTGGEYPEVIRYARHITISVSCPS